MDAATLHDRLIQGMPVEGADLAEIDWRDRIYEQPVFNDCDLTGGHFIGTGLAAGRFTRCRLALCRFSHADLREAVFQVCVFVDRTDTPKGCCFAFSDLRDARFLRSDLSFATFDRCDLFPMEMERCNLVGASFTKVDFSHAYSRKVVKTRAAVRACNMELVVRS